MRIFKKENITPITQKTTMENAQKWLNIIRYGESGTVIQLQDDCEYRVLEIINNPKILKSILGPYYKKYLLSYVPIDGKDLLIAVRKTLIGLCLERKIAPYNRLTQMTSANIVSFIAKKGYDIGLFISHVTSILQTKNYQAFVDLEFLIRTNKNLSVIVFSEQDLTSSKFDELFDKASFLFDNVINYPLYSEKDAKQFIHHYCAQWSMNIKQDLLLKIIELCGGYLWLIHEAIRHVRNNQNITPNEIVSNNLLIRKAEVKKHIL